MMLSELDPREYELALCRTAESPIDLTRTASWVLERVAFITIDAGARSILRDLQSTTRRIESLEDELEAHPRTSDQTPAGNQARAEIVLELRRERLVHDRLVKLAQQLKLAHWRVVAFL